MKIREHFSYHAKPLSEAKWVFHFFFFRTNVTNIVNIYVATTLAHTILPFFRHIIFIIVERPIQTDSSAWLHQTRITIIRFPSLRVTANGVRKRIGNRSDKIFLSSRELTKIRQSYFTVIATSQLERKTISGRTQKDTIDKSSIGG